ncbi:hypothetical protein NUW58_g2592 [Xylaria curta]|uniref:Uncharacterized protein n=1 Tax=Xylaria curta TaxID=42375 RepID=A0ACC1PI00_9PEZI|nr:hypothetical protein NUW58_g2592 [Xylaria curta]
MSNQASLSSSPYDVATEKSPAPAAVPVKNNGGRPTDAELANRLKTWPIRHSSGIKDMAEARGEHSHHGSLPEAEEVTFLSQSSVSREREKTPHERNQRHGGRKSKCSTYGQLVEFVNVNPREFEKRLQNTPDDANDGFELGADLILDIKAGARNESWQHLWKGCVALFQSSPWDLFTWGLHLTSETSEHNKIYRQLFILLPHPIWQGQLSLLRYGLQMAVYARSKGHMAPVGPLPVEIATGLFEHSEGEDNELIATIALDIWNVFKNGKNGKNGMIYLLVQEMKEICGRKPPIVRHQRNSNRLFFLSACDMDVITDALDSLYSSGRLTHEASTYHLQFTHRTADEWDSMPPRDSSCLERWDRMCVENVQMDGLKGLPNIPRNERGIYERIGYWQSAKCDYRVQRALFDDYRDKCEAVSFIGCSATGFELAELPPVTVINDSQGPVYLSSDTVTREPNLSLIIIDGFYWPDGPRQPRDTASEFIPTCAPAMLFTLFRSMLATGYTEMSKSGPLTRLVQKPFGDDLESDREAARALCCFLIPGDSPKTTEPFQGLRFKFLLTQLYVLISFPIPCITVTNKVAKFTTPQLHVPTDSFIESEECPEGVLLFTSMPSHFRICYGAGTMRLPTTMNEMRYIKGVSAINKGIDVIYNLLALVEFPGNTDQPERFWLFNPDGTHVTTDALPESMRDCFPTEFNLKVLYANCGWGTHMLVYTRTQPAPGAVFDGIRNQDTVDPRLTPHIMAETLSPVGNGTRRMANSTMLTSSPSVPTPRWPTPSHSPSVFEGLISSRSMRPQMSKRRYDLEDDYKPEDREKRHRKDPSP